MINAFIKGISYYLPEKLVTNEELVREFPEWSVEKVANKVGVESRHLAAPSETAGDMAEKAARSLFKEYNIDPSTIDFLLLCTQSPDYFLPSRHSFPGAEAQAAAPAGTGSRKPGRHCDTASAFPAWRVLPLQRSAQIYKTAVCGYRHQAPAYPGRHARHRCRTRKRLYMHGHKRAASCSRSRWRKASFIKR